MRVAAPGNFESEMERIGNVLAAMGDALAPVSTLLAETARDLALPDEEKLAAEAERLTAELPERQAIESATARLVADLAAEIGVCAQHEIPVVFIVQNNAGYMSIRGGQRKIMDRHIISEFTRRGEPYEVDFTAVAKGFGIDSVRVDESDELEPALERALANEGPTLVEVPTSRDAAGPWVPGWWDFPVPAYVDGEARDDYEAKFAVEQHQ